jgi:hypothetical protein
MEEDEIFKLKNDFLSVKAVVDKIVEVKSTIKHKLTRLKEIHSDLIKDNDAKPIFLICLESFHFQYKVMSVDTSNLHRNFLLYTNRAYCDYYNLYNLLHKVFNTYKIDVPTSTMHPVYDDLDPFAEYRLDDIYLAHDNALELLVCLICKLRDSELAVKKYKIKSQSGIRIDNFIKTLEYDNKVLKDQIELYTNYFDFFQSTQNKYFNKLLDKIVALQEEIDDDIELHETQWDETEIQETDTLTQSTGDEMVSQWTDNPLMNLTNPVHHEEMWGVCIEEIQKIDEQSFSKKKKKKK